MGGPGLRACLLLCGQGVFQTGGRPFSYKNQASLISSKVIRWKRKVEEECGNIPMVLVMTKMDLIYKATIDACEVEKLSRSLAVKLLKTSVKENLNVSSVFEFLASQHLSELSQWSVDPPIIQIGSGGFSGCSQQDFLTRYEKSWEMEEVDERRKIVERRPLWPLCGDANQAFRYNCATRAFFLAPHRKN